MKHAFLSDVSFSLRMLKRVAAIKASRRNGFRKAPAPFFMVWEATAECNLNCRCCISAMAGAQTGSELDTGEIMDLVGQAAAMGVCGLVITGGGEPLLRGDTVDVIAGAKKRGLWVALTTNGTLITPSNATHIAAADAVTVSIDSVTPEDYFMRRGVDSFREVMNALAHLRELHSRAYLTVQCVVDESNWRNIRRFNRYYHDKLFDSVFQLEFNSRFCIDPVLWQTMIQGLKYHRKSLQLAHRRFLKLFPRIAAGSGPVPCSAGISHFVVSADGKLCLCNTERAPGIDVRRTPLAKAWEDMGELRRYIDGPEKRCICGNSCFVPLAQFA